MSEINNVYPFKVNNLNCKFHIFNENSLIQIEEKTMILYFNTIKEFHKDKEVMEKVIGFHNHISNVNPNGKTKDVKIERNNGNIKIGCITLTEIEFNKFVSLLTFKESQFNKQSENIN